MRTRVLGLALILSAAVAGCTTPAGDNPRFAAWFPDDQRTIFYEDQSIGFEAHVKNVQEKKRVGGEEIGEGGTHPVCPTINGVSNATWCQVVSLVHGETKKVGFSGIRLGRGEHRVDVLNATFTLRVLEPRHVGDWINGSLVNLRLATSGKGADGRTNWTVEVAFHNGSVPVQIEMDVQGHRLDLAWKPAPYAVQVNAGLDLAATYAHVLRADWPPTVVDAGLYRWLP